MIPDNILSEYSTTLTLNNLISGHRYKFSIDTTADNIELKCNGLD